MTAVVAEDTRRVIRVDPVPVEGLRAQLEVLGAGYRIAAVKTGLLPSGGHAREVARFLRELPGGTPVVADPVLAAGACAPPSGSAPVPPSAGGEAVCGRGDGAGFPEELAPLAALVTPNLPEGRVLLGGGEGLPAEELAGALAGELGVAVLLKGGHGKGAECVDWLAFPGGEREGFAVPRQAGESPHGTGCVLSAAVAARLALGERPAGGGGGGEAALRRGLPAGGGGGAAGAAGDFGT